jgi:hypothetical protein
LKYDVAFDFRPGSFNAYRYAAFLAFQYGVSNSTSIATLLAPFKPGNDAAIALNIPAFFLSARTNPVLAPDKASLIELGRIDPNFQAYLLSLGWQASDFAASST